MLKGDDTMKKYIAMKVVEAELMDSEAASKYLGRIVAPKSTGTTHNAEYGSHPGYLVKYYDGYESWCPRIQFEKANRPCDGMTFGLAIEAAKKGLKIARKGWNGKDMFVVFMSPMCLPPFSDQSTNRKVNDRTAKWIGEDTSLDSLGYFAMFTADKKWQPGWLASQADMLADDWMIVD